MISSRTKSSLFIAGIFSCGLFCSYSAPAAGALNTSRNAENETSILSCYDFTTYMQALWSGNTVYQENAVFFEEADGTIKDISLLYIPGSIVSVRNFGLDVDYIQGQDFLLNKDGTLCLTENSRIPVMPRTAYCNAADTSTQPQLLDGGGALITDNNVISQYYLSITYTHADSWDGVVPQNEISHLAKVKHKLENKEALKIVICGDSISVGYSTSGLNEQTYRVNGQLTTARINIAPYMPTWPHLVAEALKKAYGYDAIEVVNLAIGGTNTNSACMDDVVQRILAQSPDLVTIGFGMNEYWSPAAQHSDRIEALMDKILAGCPQTEFLLLSSMLPNRMAYSMNNMNLSAFEKSYYQLQADRSDLSIAIAPVNTVYLHAADAKRDLDLMGGNRNHPNDFAVRLYAQTIAASLGVYASPVITTEALVHGSAGTDYAAKLTAIADSDIHWSVTDGDLPEGLTLHPDGRINGTPKSAGTFSFTVKASTQTNSTTKGFSITISPVSASESVAESSPIQSSDAPATGESLIGIWFGVILAVFIGAAALLLIFRIKRTA